MLGPPPVRASRASMDVIMEWNRPPVKQVDGSSRLSGQMPRPSIPPGATRTAITPCSLASTGSQPSTDTTSSEVNGGSGTIN